MALTRRYSLSVASANSGSPGFISSVGYTTYADLHHLHCISDLVSCSRLQHEEQAASRWPRHETILVGRESMRLIPRYVFRMFVSECLLDAVSCCSVGGQNFHYTSYPAASWCPHLFHRCLPANDYDCSHNTIYTIYSWRKGVAVECVGVQGM